MTTPELLAKIAAIENDPKSLATSGLYKWKPYYGRKIDKLRREIAHNMRADRIAKGLPVNDEGYSGRKSNRR